MKRILLFALLTISVVFTTTEVSIASHGMGGEITWTCLGSGQYKFKMKFYRDCNGITPGSTLQMQTTVPGTPTIQLNLVQQNDISPNGLNANGVTPCYNCVNGSFGSPIPGLVEEYVYESAPVTLTGIPPLTGWTFRWGECCRSSALTNLTGGGSLGFQNRAIMYPYNGQNTNPCFDSSPYFTEKPSTIICTGYPFKYNPNAVDPELDSLVYSWGQPLDDAGSVIPFAPGYTVNSQLPSTIQNGSNVAATIDPQTGEITYTSFTGGYFATVVKVTAYKCNIKVAEIFREINVVLNSNCPPVQTGINNSPPDVNAPFFHPVTGAPTEYIDTVYAGDTVNFFLTATDFEFFTNGGVQTITIEASGNEFGTNYTNPNAGCVIPPCATLSQSTPFSFQIGGGVGFNWVTTCDHVKGLDLACSRITNRYNFIIKATDNYCPANASNVSTISIVILAAPKLKAPVLRCASVNTDGSVGLSWTKSTPRDSQNTFFSYDVYASLTAAGPFSLVDSIKTGFNANTFTHTAASLSAMFGTNAQQTSIYYYLRTRSGCDGDSVSVPSDTLRTIKLNAALNGSNEAVLTWNALRVPLLSSHDTKYKIYKNFPIGTWTLIDSTAALTYTDTTTKVLCNDSVAYRVQLPDSSGCISVSSLDGILVTNPNPIATILPANPAFCTGGNVILTANVGLSYLWNTLATTQSITVTNAGTYTVTVTQAGNCTATGSTTVTVNPLPNPVITGNFVVCQGTCATFNAGPGFTTYAWSTGATTQSISVCTSGPYAVTVTTAFGCSKSTSQSLTVNPNPAPVITGIDTICQGQSTNLNAGGGYQSYLWAPGGATTQIITVTNPGTYTVTVNAFNQCTGTDNQVVVVNPLPNPVISGDLSICQGLSTTLSAQPGFTTYQWSTGATTQSINVSTATIVTVTVSNANGCVKNTSATTIVNPNPVPTITGTMTVCQGLTTAITPGPGYSTYSWSTGATTQTINIGTAGPVTVTVTDINGCIGSDNANITVYSLPSATISGIDTICSGQSSSFNITFAGPGPYVYTYFNGVSNQGPFTTVVGSVNIPVSPTANTNYTLVSVTNANTLCNGTISGQARVVVTPLPTALLTGTTDICSGSSTNLSINFTGVGPYTYSYLAGATVYGPFTTNNDPEIVQVTPSNTTVYSLTPTVIGAGCTGTTNPATATVTVNVLPSASIAGNNTICAGETTNLIINFNGTGPFTYTYSNGINNFGPFNTPNDPHTVTVTPGVNTTYTLVSISDANCTGSVAGSANINVNPLPTATISGTNSICEGGNLNISIMFTGTGPYTYSYNDGTNVFGPFTTNQNPAIVNVSPAATTTYGVTSVNDVNCTGTVAGAATVTVIPLPTATLAGSTDICIGSSTNLQLTITGVPPFEYKYTDGTTIIGPFTTNNTNVLINVAPTSNTTYSLTTITGAGCAGSYSGSASIVVNPLPQATLVLTGDDIICAGEGSQFNISFIGTGPFNYSYTDGSSTFGPFTALNNPEIIPVTPGSSTTYTPVSITDQNCTGTVTGSAQITVNPLPTAAASANLAICDGSSTSFSINFTGTGPFTYTYTDGSSTIGPVTTSSNPEIINVNPNVTTTYNVLTVTDANCTGTTSGTVNVTVNNIPTAAISGSAEICIGASTDLTINFTGVAPFTYVYTNGTTNFGPLVATTNSAVIPVSPGINTTYSLVSLNDANCPGTLSGNVQITVNPLPQPVITGDFEICDGETSTLNATAGFTTYTWSNGLLTPSITTSTAGVYTVTVIDGNGCVGTSPAINFIVNQTPVISFTNDTSLTCEIPSINFQNNSSYPAGSEFTWDFGDNSGISNQVSPSHLYNAPGVYDITLTITTQAGCTATLTQSTEIMFFPLPVADFTANPMVTNIFNAKVAFTDESDYAVSWTWEFGDSDKSSQQNPIHYFNDIGAYRVKLTVTNIAGCMDEKIQEIVVNPFYIPNAFTPNDDGTNDAFFEAGYVLDVQSYNMAIFNRWGQVVYEADNYNKFWSGYDKDGNKAPEGVYVYSIDVVTKGGKKHNFNGTVTLIR